LASYRRLRRIHGHHRAPILDITRLQADTGFGPQHEVERAVPDFVDGLRRPDW
jgi:nucleoside-diphosphate-sugar epimerase